MKIAAQIIKTANSQWEVSVLIAQKRWEHHILRSSLNFKQKKESSSVFCAKSELVLDEWNSPKCFGKLYLFAGYLQGKLVNLCLEMTDFQCKYGSCQFQLMPFWFMNTPAMFQRMTQKLFENIKFVKIYKDNVDVFISPESISEYIDRLTFVIERIAKTNLKVKLSKCVFERSEQKFPWYIVSKNGTVTDPERMRCVIKVTDQDFKKALMIFYVLLF